MLKRKDGVLRIAVSCLNLGESFATSLESPKSASIQRRTSVLRFLGTQGSMWLCQGSLGDPKLRGPCAKSCWVEAQPLVHQVAIHQFHHPKLWTIFRLQGLDKWTSRSAFGVSCRWQSEERVVYSESVKGTIALSQNLILRLHGSRMSPSVPLFSMPHLFLRPVSSGAPTSKCWIACS